MNMRYIIYVFLTGVFLFAGCTKDNPVQQQAKWEITLMNSDTRPYGTYLAYQSLKHYFPSAKIEALPRRFKFSNMDEKMKYNYEGRSLIIFEGLYCYFTDEEWEDLKQFVKNGNEIVIFSSWLDNKVETDLGCNKENSGEENNKYYPSKEDFDNKDMLCLDKDKARKYGYEGRSLKGYFTFNDATDTAKADTAVSTDDSTTANENAPVLTDTLGYCQKHPDFLRYKYGEGHITVHAAPLALSNFFLLQDGNENYLTAIWQTIPIEVNRIYWNDFYYRDTTSSSWDILWRYPATHAALILGIILLLIYILFEGKRKQRIIPIIPPLKNDSVSFVETVGRLYYNKGNHSNLADKMVQQFLEWVRTHYFLNTNMINDNFISQLTIKSGQPEAKVRGLIETIHEIRLGGIKVDDAYLYQLYTTIQQFYKKQP